MKTKKFLALLLAAVISFVCLFVGCKTDNGEQKKISPENTVKQYLEAIVAFDNETIVDIDYTKYDLEAMGLTKEGAIKRLDEQTEENKAEMQAKYGDNVRIADFEVIEKYQYEDLDQIPVFYQHNRGYDEGAIEGVTLLQYKYKMVGDSAEESFDCVSLVILVDDKWVLDRNFDDMDTAKTHIKFMSTWFPKMND